MVSQNVTNLAATIEDWIFSYDKIPDPILISCGIDDSLNMTDSECSTDMIPPLRVYEDYDNMTEVVDLAMMYWANRYTTLIRLMAYFTATWSPRPLSLDSL